MLLSGFGFSGYRSVGDKLVKIGPLKKVNLIIGKNNVGKSNIINFLNKQYSSLLYKAKNKSNNMTSRREIQFLDVDYHISDNKAKHRISFSLFGKEIDDFIYLKLPDEKRHHVSRQLAKKLLLSEHFYDESGSVWFTYCSSNINGNFELEIDVDKIEKVLTYSEWNQLWGALTSSSGGDIKAHWIPATLTALSYTPDKTPNIEVISAIRKIGNQGSEANDFSGEGIIERIARIQNPQLSEQKLKQKFHSINLFIQDVLENATAEIEVPYERNMILVHMDGKTLPLESLGTGVHEVVILAAAATLLDKSVLCVEEPELHLHPLLQRKLIKYLCDNTDNQYFFTTHSAHLLDAVESEIFHVTQSEGVSYVDAISSTKQRSNICNDLGYKASDILQANCVIWVEGPSDRIYLNYWIQAYTCELVEGVHYSIMFYGGRLFSHLTALDQDSANEAADELISIRKLNRNAVIMFDSDKNRPRAQINNTKHRLKNEFNSGPGFSWITSGREVENYLDFDKLEESIKAVHPTAANIVAKSEWSNLLIYKKKHTAEEKTANKVKVARHYIENNLVNFKKLDLEARIKQLVEFIKTANN